ncbi:MAG: hypothetical protein QXU01_03090 [Candidatus Hadarchaeales archaeon]
MAVRRPEDVLKGRKHLLEEAAKDLGADQLERVRQLLERWDEKARLELFVMLGEERAKKLLRDLGIL